MTKAHTKVGLHEASQEELSFTWQPQNRYTKATWDAIEHGTTNLLRDKFICHRNYTAASERFAARPSTPRGIGGTSTSGVEWSDPVLSGVLFLYVLETSRG